MRMENFARRIAIARKQARLSGKNPSDYGMSYKDYSFTVGKNDKLVAWYIKNEREITILIVPGHRTRKELYLELAQEYYKRGFPVILFDPRGQGESTKTKKYCFGYYEIEDVNAIIDFFSSQHFALLGFSCGATVALICSLQNKHKVAATIADSGFVNLQRVSDTKKDGPIQTFLKQGMIGTIERRQRNIPDLLSRLNLQGRCEKLQNVYLVHGKKDRITNWRNSVYIHDKAQKPKDLWTPPDTGHCQTVLCYGEQYVNKTIRFINKCRQER